MFFPFWKTLKAESSEFLRPLIVPASDMHREWPYHLTWDLPKESYSYSVEAQHGKDGQFPKEPKQKLHLGAFDLFGHFWYSTSTAVCIFFFPKATIVTVSLDPDLDLAAPETRHRAVSAGFFVVIGPLRSAHLPCPAVQGRRGRSRSRNGKGKGGGKGGAGGYIPTTGPRSPSRCLVDPMVQVDETPMVLIAIVMGEWTWNPCWFCWWVFFGWWSAGKM